MLSCLASNGTENRCKVSTSPKISEKPTRSAPASRGPRFRDLRRRFLLPNRTVLRHKWFECGLWPPASCQEADCGSMGTEFASC